MNVTFHDLQQLTNPINGTRLESMSAVGGFFRSQSGRKPFMFELRGENGCMLTIGLADGCAAVQHSSSEGSPPYLMAVAIDASDARGFVEFLAGGTLTPIPERFCLPVELAEKVVADFLIEGGKSEAVIWEEI